MLGRTHQLTISLATVLLLMAPGAIAWATSCPTWASEERYYAVTSITQLDGTSDHVGAERMRWGGKTRVTLASELDQPSLELWLRVHVEDGPVRNVTITTAAPLAEDTSGSGDTGGPGDTGEQGGAR